MFRSRIDLGGKTRVLKVGLLASPALLRCQRSLNSLVKCTTSRLPLNCLWTRQKSTCLNINEAAYSWQGSSSHTYLFVAVCGSSFSWKHTNKRCCVAFQGTQIAVVLVGAVWEAPGLIWGWQEHTGKWNIYMYIKGGKHDIMWHHHIKAVISNRGANSRQANMMERCNWANKGHSWYQ